MKTGNYERALPLNGFSEPSIFPRPFTVDEPCVEQAAWFFHMLETAPTLNLNEPFLLYLLSSPMTDNERLGWLPALAVAIRHQNTGSVLNLLAQWPVPENLPAVTRPWLTHLEAAWEVHRHRRDRDRDTEPFAIGGLVRLDRYRPDSRLPEWLALLRQTIRWRHRPRYERLTALAAWKPSPAANLPPEALTGWIDVWKHLYRPSNGHLSRLIAVQALLNVAETRAEAIGIPPGQLLSELARLITDSREDYPGYDWEPHCLEIWHPARSTPFPPEAVRPVISAWAEVAGVPESSVPGDYWWDTRWVAWNRLMHCEREGWLKHCEIDFLTFLARAVREVEDSAILMPVVGWAPPERLESIRADGFHPSSSGTPPACRQSPDWGRRWQGWLEAKVQLHTGALSGDEERELWQDYCHAIRNETETNNLWLLMGLMPKGVVGGMLAGAWLGRQQGGCPEPAFVAHVVLWRYLESRMSSLFSRLDVPVAPGTGRDRTEEVGYHWLLRRECHRFRQSAGINVHPGWLPSLKRLRDLAAALSAGHDPSLCRRRMSSSPVLSSLPEQPHWLAQTGDGIFRPPAGWNRSLSG